MVYVALGPSFAKCLVPFVFSSLRHFKTRWALWGLWCFRASHANPSLLGLSFGGCSLVVLGFIQEFQSFVWITRMPLLGAKRRPSHNLAI